MQSLKKIINNNLFLHKKIKNKSNNLVQAVEYTIYNISNQDLIFYSIFQHLINNIPNQLTNTIKEQYITSFYCHYTAYQNIYNLPSMINNNTYNNQESTHIKFNEAISYLVSLTLINESLQILIKLNSNNKDELLKIKKDESLLNNNNISVFENFGNISKMNIIQDNNLLKINILIYLIKSTLILLNFSYKQVSQLEIIKSTCQDIVNDYQNINEIMCHFIREISINN